MILTFGEVMMRLSTMHFERFGQATQFDINYGGSEVNVAAALCGFGESCAHLTALPDNAIGHACALQLQKYGVSLDRILWQGSRLGIYYLETGASLRASKVVYDRADSAIAQAKPEDFDWEKIFRDVDWFHISGITPSLSPALACVSLQACKYAQNKGITVSCDLNYRKNLWSKEACANTMDSIYRHMDVLIANESQIAEVFDLDLPDEESEQYSEMCQKLLHERFDCRNVALTRRRTVSASKTIFSASLWDGTHFEKSPVYQIGIVDRVGSGDAFSAGLIYGLHNGMTPKETVSFGVSSAVLKHTMPGDVLLATKEEVIQTANGAGGRIQR